MIEASRPTLMYVLTECRGASHKEVFQAVQQPYNIYINVNQIKFSGNYPYDSYYTVKFFA